MAELIEHLERNNLLIGTPQLYTPMVSVEHVDGSPLSPIELECIKNGGINLESYQQRITDVL